MTDTHKLAEQALADKDLLPTILYGCAGTGKTCSAVGAAVKWLEGKNKKVVITRPNESFAKENGFLPGTEREKMEPWVRPIKQNFVFHEVSIGQQSMWEKSGRLTYLPLEFIQGLTWDDTFIIVDECQNMTFEQYKVLLTRVGKWSKIVLCGDVAQVSPKFKGSGLAKLIDMINRLDIPVHTIEFGRDDILRSEQCKMWISAFEDYEIKEMSDARSRK